MSETDLETGSSSSPRPANVQRLVLFRKQALEAADRYPVADMPDRRAGNRILTLVLLGMVCAAAMLGLLIQQIPVEQIRGKVVLLPPTAAVHVPQDGTILAINEPIGSFVARGTPLMTIDVAGSDREQVSGQRREDLNKVRRNIDELIAKRQATAAIYAERLASNLRTRDALVVEIASNQGQVDALRKTADLLSEKRGVIQKLVDTSAMSREEVRNVGIDYQRAESDFYEQQTALLALRRTLGEKEREEPALIAEREATIAEIDASLAGLRASEARLSQRPTMTVSAPIDGKLTYIDVQVGDAVAAGSSLAVVAPVRREPFARFDVPSETIRKFSLGDSSAISVTYNSVAAGTETVGATITSLSSVPIGANGTDYKLLAAFDARNKPVVIEGMDATLNITKPYFSLLDAFLPRL